MTPEHIGAVLDDVATQLDLRLASDDDAARWVSHEERFRRFHKANPGVYAALVALARRGIAAGERHLGIGMLWEVLRWHTITGDTVLGEGFKLNNNYRSRYARLIMEQEDDLAEVFEVRRLRS